MEIVRNLALLLHLIGFAAVFGGAFVQIKDKAPKINAAILHGATTLLVTGLILVTLLELGDSKVNHMKVGIKLVVLIVLFVLAVKDRKAELAKSN